MVNDFITIVINNNIFFSALAPMGPKLETFFHLRQGYLRGLRHGLFYHSLFVLCF